MSLPVAVLVIDTQQGLCEGKGRAYDSDAVIERINTVTRQARQVGATVIFIQHQDDSLLIHGTPAWQLARGLQVEVSDLRVQKTTPDSFLHTELESVLSARGIRRLVICGMHTEFCVDTTTRRGLAMGYPVTLVADAHTSAGNDVITAPQVIAHHNATLANISSFGPRAVAVRGADVDFSAS